jgi:hypothetical protein
MTAELVYGDHAFKRTAERSIAPQHAYYVWRHGTQVTQPDGTFARVLRYTDLPTSDRKSHVRLVGLMAILKPDGRTVITAYPCEGRCSGASPSCFCWGAFRRKRLQLLRECC